MLDIIYISDLNKYLPYKDNRSLCDYCQQNNVKVFGKFKRRYVLAVSFHRALLNEKINHLKEIYGNAWTSVLKSEMNLFSKLQSALDEIQSGRSNSTIIQRTKPKGKAESKFLLDIKKILS